MKRYILSLSFLCSALLACLTTMPSCLGDDGTMFSLEPGNPLKMLPGVWRIKDIFKNAQSPFSVGSVKLPQGGNVLQVGDVLSFGDGINGLLGQSGTFSLINASGTVKLPWAFTQTVVENVPYTGGIKLGGLNFLIRCWTSERWIIYPEGDDDPYYIEFEHDDDYDGDKPYVEPDPIDNGCSNVVKRIVKQVEPWHGDQMYGDIRTTVYTFKQSPLTFSIGSTTYTYQNPEPNICALFQDGSGAALKTYDLRNHTEAGVSMILNAKIESSGNWHYYQAEMSGSYIKYSFNSSSKYIDIEYSNNGAAAGSDNRLSGHWSYSFGSHLNDTSIDLNFLLAGLWDRDPAVILPLAIYDKYGGKEKYLIDAEIYRPNSYDYDLRHRRNFVVTKNDCGYPTCIEFDEYEMTNFKTGHYKFTIEY